MATYITKKCPQCGAVYERSSYAHSPSKANRTKYGSPVLQCKNCGTLFKDDEYREIAVDGIRNVDLSVVSPYSIFFAVFGLIMLIITLSTGSPITYALAMYLLFFFSAWTDVLSYKKRLKYFDAERAESERRLSNPDYAQALKKLGYDVPDKYLSPSSQTRYPSYTSGGVISDEPEQKDKHKAYAGCLAFLIGLFVGILGHYAWVNIYQDHLEKWQAEMEKVSLFDAVEDAGTKMVVYEQERTPNDPEYHYDKHYLPSGKVASNPDEVGYIFVVKYTYNKEGEYSSSLLPIGKAAYRVDTVIRLYDRHTGLYVGDEQVLRGGDPPNRIKTSEPYGAGSIAGASYIRSAIGNLIAGLEDGDDE